MQLETSVFLQQAAPVFAPPVTSSVKGMYCVVAHMPCIDSKGKTSVTLKFWNCILCSNYFLQKPEIVFRIEQPYLFTDQPEWLYQAALCRACCQCMRPATQRSRFAYLSKNQITDHSVDKPNDTRTGSEERVGQSYSGQLPVTSSVGSKEAKRPLFILPKPVSHSGSLRTSVLSAHVSPCEALTTKENAPQSTMVSSVAKATSSVRTVLSESVCSPFTEAIAKGNNLSSGFNEAETEHFHCPICSKHFDKLSEQLELSRVNFPKFSSVYPEDIDQIKVCATCFARLSQKVDQLETAGIPDKSSTKVWTGIETTEACSLKQESNGMKCFVCERELNYAFDQARLLRRWKYPSLFSGLRKNLFDIMVCNSCYKRIYRLRMKFDKASLEEDKRQYAEFINSWREQKGLEKLHL